MKNLIVPSDSEEGRGTIKSGDLSVKQQLVGRGDQFSKLVQKYFRSLGISVAERPWTTILLCLTLTAVAAIGLLRFSTENRGDKLWVPANSIAQDHDRRVNVHFSQADFRLEQFYLWGKENVLTPDVVDKGHEIMQRVLGLTGENGIAWKDYCYKDGSGACVNASVIDFLDDWREEDSVENKTAVLQSLKSPSDCSINDTRFELSQVLGGFEPDPNGKTSTAKVLAFIFLLQNNLVVTSANAEVDEKAEELENAFLQLMQNESRALASEGLTISYFTARSLSDEFGAELDGDTQLLSAALMLVLFYAVVMLSRWSEGWKGIRLLLCIGGTLSIGMSIACTFGISSAIGLFYSPLTGILPFLLLGIGVDDMFVIVNAFDNSPEDLEIPKRIGHALATAGSSITVTSLTDILAFFIGSFTSLPALRNFSIYAAFGILFDYAFQVTFFVAFLTFDARRRAAGPPDCTCCCAAPEVACGCLPCVRGREEPPKDADPEQQAAAQGVAPQASKTGEGSNREETVLSFPSGKPQGMQMEMERGGQSDEAGELANAPFCGRESRGFFSTDDKLSRLFERYGGFLSRPWAKALVLTVFAGIAAVGALGVARIEVAGDINNFIPAGSYLKSFVQVTEEYFNEVGDRVYAYVLHDDSACGTTCSPTCSFAGDLVRLADAMDSSEWISACSVSMLPQELQGICNNEASGDDFTRLVAEYMENNETSYKQDVNLTDGKLSLRISADFVFLEDSDRQVKAMDALRDLVNANFDTDTGHVAFAFAENFLSWEGYKSIGLEALRNIGLAMLMVMFVTVILLIDPWASITTFLNILLVVIEIIGFLHFWGLTIDNVSVIFVVVSLGLSVDYSVHVAHDFLHKKGAANDRMVATLKDMGTAVMNGVSSTWIAVMLLAGSGSYVFSTFFKALFLCTTLGMVHSLVLLPVVLTLVKPRSVATLTSS
uniref:Niemann-Pick C1 protein n=2 Tax=Tetraselmis sp. GSL018 TaxID=582737 RepID=A0A061RV36_9CHLO|mmetsp:Transcript_6576/g.15809  ORF Transcript_6576/g.15809 Transcript_6576/m.15809 type:complete len:946 (+) Transcript_6576:96-2933(+)